MVESLLIPEGGAFITEKFMNLDPEKRKIILDAAFEEFADYSYEYASTNRIVKKANIGKGMLFYYFNSKKDLFNYLVEYGIDYIVNDYLSKIDVNERDFIKRYKQAAMVKMKAYAENPHIFNFLGNLHLNEYTELEEELKGRIFEIKANGFAVMFNNIDKSLFRDDIDSKEVIRLINLTLAGYEMELTNSLRGKKLSSMNFDSEWDDFDVFLDLLRQIYYK